MDIRQSTSQATLLDVFRTRRRTGDSIAEFELVREWAHTGLRWADLEAALDHLTRRGLLSMRFNDGRHRVVLTRAGHRAVETRQWLLRLSNWCRVQWLRLDTLAPTQTGVRP